MGYSNMFNNGEKSLEGKVVVQLHPNPMRSTSGQVQYYAKVVRSTADDAAVATEMTKHTDLVRFNDMTPVMSAFVASVKTLLGQGNCVRVSGLGTFYPRVVGGVTTPTPTVADLGQLKVGFTNAQDLHLAVADTEIAAIVDVDTNPAIASEVDMTSMDPGFTISSTFTVKGKYLRLAGTAAQKCGLFLAPKLAAGGYDADETKWLRVDDDEVYTNKPSALLARCPSGAVSGSKYFLIIRTLAPSSVPLKYKDDGTGKMAVDPDCLLKTARFGVSEECYMVN